MLENLQLAAIVKRRSTTELLQVQLIGELQEALANDWESQCGQFLDETELIPFNAGYSPERHERFHIPNFPLPDWLQNAYAQGFQNLDTIGAAGTTVRYISGIVGIARTDSGEELMLFQNFTQSRVIRPARILSLDLDAWLVSPSTFVNNDRPGLILDSRLSAVIKMVEQTLIFRNYRTVNTFLPLSAFYREASEQDIREVLSHPVFDTEDADGIVSISNEWFRKRFAMLKDSRILDDYSASEIRDRSEGYDVSIEVVNGKLVFPADKLAAMQLLKYLNEELFRGAITNTLYETNSRRPVGTN